MTRPSENAAEALLPGPPESDASASPSPRLTKNRTFIAVVAVLVVTAVAGIVLLVNFRGKSDEAQIQQVVVRFAAVDMVDQARIVSLLRQEEATVFTDSDGYDPANNGGVATPENYFPAATTSDIHIVGDVASTRVTRSETYSTTLYFRKENGEWKVCAPAADKFSVNVGNR